MSSKWRLAMSESGISRRRLIQTTVGVTVLLAAATDGQVLLTANAIDDKANTERLVVHETDTLRQMVKRLFPYRNLSEEPYRLVVNQVRNEKSVADVATLLREGVGVLDSGVTGKQWLALSKAQQIEVMKRIETSAFFQLMLNTSIHSLHANREVWHLIGYPGSSVEYGGYINRGFNDIDWLPEETS